MKLNAEVMEVIRARCEKATPGPWKWTQNEWNAAKYMDRLKNGKYRAKPGMSARQSWFYLLQARPHGGFQDTVNGLSVAEIVKQRICDEYDFSQVFALRWESIKGSEVINAGPTEEDADFIAESRNDVPLLLSALEDAYSEIDRLKAELAGQ